MKQPIFLLFFFIYLFLFCDSSKQVNPVVEADVIIYGGTSAAITAAVQVARMNKTVVVVSPAKHLGGLTSGGLGWTDTGRKEVIGGLAREFYHRIWRHYQKPDAWRWQERAEYGNRGQGNRFLMSGLANTTSPFIETSGWIGQKE
jgi:hypothetical protein